MKISEIINNNNMVIHTPIEEDGYTVINFSEVEFE